MNKEDIIKEFQQRFYLPNKSDIAWIEMKLDQVETATLEKAKQDTAGEIWQLLNSLETRQPEELKTDNWRNWKYIRNTIADKYNLRKDLPVFSTNTNPVDEEEHD